MNRTIALFTSVCALSLCWLWTRQSSRLPEILNLPVSVKPVYVIRETKALPEGWCQVAAKFSPERPTKSLAEILHHIENKIPETASCSVGNQIREELLESILEGTRHRMHPINPSWLFRDTSGMVRVARYTAGEVEAHPAQILATLASLGTPSDYQISSGGEVATVAELVEALRDDFHLYGEVEWKIMALCRYAPTDKSWTNRWGKSFSFDQITHHLLQLPQGQGSCNGTHLLQTLAVLLEVDGSKKILSTDVRAQIVDHLKDVVDRLQRGQRAEGYWAPDWVTPHPNREDYDQDPEIFQKHQLALITGHHLEWLDLLQDDLDIDQSCRMAAVKWCIGELQRASRGEIQRHFCPYSHCFRAATRNAEPRMWSLQGQQK